MDSLFFFIKEQYFIDHSDFMKILDSNDPVKQSHRTYVCVKIDIDDNTFYLPLRTHLGKDVRPFGRIGHSVPSQKRLDAGIDYRYALVINDIEYLESCADYKLPNAQRKKITKDYEEIQTEFKIYLNGYKKAVVKNRLRYEPLSRESSLVNFNEELNLSEYIKQKAHL